MCCMYTVYSGMQEWVIQKASISILVSVLFPSLHLRIKFLLLVFISTQNFILDVGMEKQELGWRVLVLPIPAFHCILCTCNM